jgi:predicted nucleic acid-binding protein
VKLYLDLCCLKRPFDDPAQTRIRMETTAVLAIEDAVEAGSIEAVRSVVHDLENVRNPDAGRAQAISRWLSKLNVPQTTPATVATLTQSLARVGLKLFDAYHLAWAEHLEADVFVTCDDRILSRADQVKHIRSI